MRSIRSLTRPLVVAVVLAIALSGCAGAPPYSGAAATDLQSRVLAVSEAAAEADYATLVTRIDELSAAADSALARGEIAPERHASILSAAGLVRADGERMGLEAEAARVAAIQAAEDARRAAEQAAEDSRRAAEQAAEDAAQAAEDAAGRTADNAKDARDAARKAAEQAQKDAQD